MDPQLSIVRGTLDLLVLRALRWGPMHGFGITTWLEERSTQMLELDDSALYQALNRLEAKGFIESEWGITENNRRARYYSLRPSGRAHLDAATARWVRYSELVTEILTGARQVSAKASRRS